MVIDTSKLLHGSWKTSASGFVFTVASIVAANPGDFVKWPTLVAICKFIAIGAAGAGLKFAKDGNVTGGTTPNPTNDPTAVAATATKPAP